MNMDLISNKYIQMDDGEFVTKRGQAQLRRMKRQWRRDSNRRIRDHGKWEPGTLEYRLLH